MFRSLPPEPPKEAVQHFHQMAEYYRNLIEYHQNAIAEAELRLSHLEILLGESSEASLIDKHSVLSSADSNLSADESERIAEDIAPQSASGSATRSLNELESTLSAESVEAQPGEKETALDDTEVSTKKETALDDTEVSTKDEKLLLEASQSDLLFTESSDTADKAMSEEIEALLEENRGKILHLDFIVKELAASEPVELEVVTTAVDEQLQEGATQGRWAKIPDAPDCWTIDLTVIPDIVAKKEPQSKSRAKTQAKKGKSKGGKPANIPSSPKLEEYPNLPAAIQSFLQEQYPSPARTGDIFDWLYPEGLPKQQGDKAKKAIGNALLNHLDRLGWAKVGTGLYQWKGA